MFNTLVTELLPGTLIISRGRQFHIICGKNPDCISVCIQQKKFLHSVFDSTITSICSNTTVLSQKVLLVDGHKTPSYLLTLMVD